MTQLEEAMHSDNQIDRLTVMLDSAGVARQRLVYEGPILAGAFSLHDKGRRDHDRSIDESCTYEVDDLNMLTNLHADLVVKL
jgi:hypothetical protein